MFVMRFVDGRYVLSLLNPEAAEAAEEAEAAEAAEAEEAAEAAEAEEAEEAEEAAEALLGHVARCRRAAGLGDHRGEHRVCLPRGRPLRGPAAVMPVSVGKERPSGEGETRVSFSCQEGGKQDLDQDGNTHSFTWCRFCLLILLHDIACNR